MTAVVEGFTLSPQQARLWKLHKGGLTASASFRAGCVLRPAERLDAAALELALHEAVRRNEILRTGFHQLPGMEVPLQVIGEPSSPILEEIDLSGCPPEEHDERIGELLHALSGDGEGPLLRAALIHLPEDQRLLLGLPALCTDLAGLANLAAEVERCHRALLQGGRPGDEPIQYADVASWMHDLLESQDGVARRYWQARDVSAALDAALPLDRPAAGGAFSPRRLALPLEPWLAQALPALARESGIPLSAVLLTAWALVLQRLTGRRAVVVGTAFDGRRHAELVDALGLFARHLPVSLAAADGVPFAAAARSVAATLEEMAEWQESFDGTGADGEPHVFPFCFELSRAGGDGLLSLHAFYDRFELKLACFEGADGLRAEIQYDGAALHREDAARVGEWLTALLREAVEQPEAAACGLDLLTVDNRERLRALNDTAFDFGPARTLAERFEEQADRTPDRIAAVFGGSALTYAELDRQANRLARRLRSLGVGPDCRVALSVERSLEMVVGLLGILKAGGAYVPVDPAYPEARRAFMLEDAKAPVVLTQERFAAELPAGIGIVCLDRDAAGIAAESPERLPGLATPDHLAYVIYTSGSTGRPKGVMISHRAISNRLLWQQRAFPLGEDDRVLQKTPASFDASVWEIFLPLFFGARLVVAEPGGHQDAGYLVRAVAEHGITTLQLVPSLLGVFLEEPGVREGCRTLRRLFCGGEAYPAELARRCLATLDVEICNLYGPTEVSIDASFHRGPAGPEDTVVPIGRPLDNAALHLLDSAGRRVPPGLTGELFVGGPGLARGYLDRPDLTAERFVPDPFASSPGGRLYRTGDRALLAEVEVRFLGRIDQQVKVRGFRIELGEIETLLQQHPAVRSAAVVVREDVPGDPRLVAYAVPGRRAELTAEELRGFLAARFPEHMVPAALVILDDLPRLPNGKVDRVALPAPDTARADQARTDLAPRTPVEALLAGIWSETLGLDRVGVHDNFFELGGHSLIATRMAARVREAFRIDLPVRKLFEAPTVAGLAAEVDQALRAAGGTRRPPLRTALRDGHLPLSFGQQRLWFLQQLEPESAAYNIPGALRLQGFLDREALERSVTEIVRRHEALRTTFGTVQGEPVQTVHPATPVCLPVDDLSLPCAEDREVILRELIGSEASRPFDLATGPLLRLQLFRLAEDDHVLFFNLHHIVSDGWSVGVLVRELTALYTASLRGEAAALPELPVQYGDFARWQRQWLQGEVLDAQLSYWRERLAGAPEVLNLAIDRPRPAVQTYRGATRGRRLPAELAESLRRFSREASATLFTTLLAAFKVLLQRYGAGDDLVVGTNVAGRDQIEIEGLIGFFVNSLVLRTVLDGGPTFLDAVTRVRETVLGAFAHQDLPFDRVVEELQPWRDLSVTPLFQVVFDMDPADKAGGLELPGLALSSVPLANRSAKFDLNLTVDDRPEGLMIVAEHSVDLLEGATVERLLGHLENLLRAAVAEPGSRARALPMLDEAELRQLLSGFQGPRRTGYPLDQPIQRLFERQTAGTPDEIAAVCGAERLSYAELDRRAGRLAAVLRGLGVRPGTFVGILDERGLDFLVAILAILEAGGAYVPFEPGYPDDRLRYMVADSGIEVLVTRDSLVRERLSGLAGLRALVCIGRDEAGVPAPGVRVELFDPEAPGEAPDALPTGDPRDPAYMLYTSGSTGLPKGAVIRHDGAVNHIWAQFEDLGLGAELRFLQSAPSSSDISVWQFLAPVVIGGRTVIADLETVSDPRRLLRLLREEGITLAELVPAVLRGLLDHAAELEPEERALPALRWMMATGEAVPVDLIADWFAVYPEIPAVNAYGPTEASDDVTQLLLTGPPPAGTSSLPIGRPLANFSCYVVDRDFQPVPVGVPGELCIAGIGVGNGYWRKPEKTAAAFAPNPFAESPGEVLYRTGDLSRWLADGNLEFLGRIDHQVKIRGFRIELGEIEAALREHPAVHDAVAVVRDDGAGKALVAYVAAGEELEIEGGALRDLLQERLPGHMVPAACVVLAALPRTPNGKVNRRALPAPERSGAAGSGPYTPPRTATEQKLARIWAEVFRLDRVDVHADFFDLGGHSLLASRVLARVQTAFEIEIPLRRIFEHSTISSFARIVEEAQRGTSSPQKPGIRRVERQARRVSRLSEEELELAGQEA
ncbi:MAG TPA: amino acid adenylation domain-containing protein [Thermoanaerobaculia bacterium]|nr:amino acid adenylation domain-containing protein [Thermoanaerobaculia bacterium]